ncbi:MAG: hypothetical protein JWN48_3790 [Myxococcaceae bacterium]|nr:hypothetical protein [Myxococcaceae bacterium]
MQLVDRIEKRRFVGREFLLWLWFESELFDATLSTREHGPFGLWLERRLVLSEGKESTRITAPTPGSGREAKEALLRGQLPESAGIRIAWRDDETALILKAETLGVSGLKLQTILGGKEEEPNQLLEEMMGTKGKKPKARKEADDSHEVFYERMQMTGEFEELMETLYRDFLALRLSESWRAVVTPLLRGWVLGAELDLGEYELLRRPPQHAVSDVLELKTGKRAPPEVEAALLDADLVEAVDGEAVEVSEADLEEVADEAGEPALSEPGLEDELDEPRVALGE